jgi:hypothetical protein
MCSQTDRTGRAYTPLPHCGDSILAEPSTGADALQLTLVPRFSFRARLTAGVRLPKRGKIQRDSKRYDVYYVHHIMGSKNKTRQLYRRKTTRL